MKYLHILAAFLRIALLLLAFITVIVGLLSLAFADWRKPIVRIDIAQPSPVVRFLNYQTTRACEADQHNCIEPY
jgi:hypothetical protein